MVIRHSTYAHCNLEYNVSPWFFCLKWIIGQLEQRYVVVASDCTCTLRRSLSRRWSIRRAERCDGCLGGAEEVNSEQLINDRIYCQVMDEAASVQSVLEIFQANWKECMDWLTRARFCLKSRDGWSEPGPSVAQATRGTGLVISLLCGETGSRMWN